MVKSDVDWDSVHRSNFEHAAFMHINWIRKARELFESAKVLEPAVARVWESYRARLKGDPKPLAPDYYQGAYFMLLSFAVENLLKAAAISRYATEYHEEFRKTKKFPKQLQSHDLIGLALIVQLDYDAKEEDLLRRLARSAIWFGRYPVPLHYTKMSGHEKFNDGEDYSLSWFGGNDIRSLDIFVSSLPSRLGFHQRFWDAT